MKRKREGKRESKLGNLKTVMKSGRERGGKEEYEC
jgi:hypothetical protein